MDFWSRFDYDGEEEWPEFTQLAVSQNDARLDQLIQALQTVASIHEVRVEDVSDTPEAWDGALVVAQNGDTWCVSEPGVDLEDRFLTSDWAEQIAGLLACDAVFFGHTLSTATVHATTFETGGQNLAWFDSALPGPSFARVFHRDGRCTEEDPRSYALEALDMPTTSPLLDRYAFVASLLEPMGIHTISPDLDAFEVELVLQIRENS